ncbi:exodeoxyribonuclease I [Buchnera aphidicola]|uniref:exodeoxyribonuclease I n=1 Tax=Buchnera aphidicola TaxID=9 RepID=UPI0034638CD6
MTIINFLFYDYETFGINPALDKPSQFACIRTDQDFNIIDNIYSIYCSPPDDYLPNLRSVLITGITPQYAISNGINEYYFSKKIYDIFSVKNTCIIGYNNIRFDDEFTRNIFYRNFFDPYGWHWKNNNSRWDLINIVRSCYVFCPNILVWPKNNGLPTFKLSHLTDANNIIHSKVHNASSDIYATLELAKLIKSRTPKLFHFLFSYRIKNRLKMLVNQSCSFPLIYISACFGNARNNMSCIFPIFWNVQNLNMLIFFDLYMDINQLIIYIKNKKNYNNFTMKDLNLLGINILYINQCPALFPINFLDRTRFLKFGINIENYLLKISILKKNLNLFKQIDFFFRNYKYQNNSDDVDLQIYSSFFNQYDISLMKMIHCNIPLNLQNINFKFSDLKIYEMLFRYRARNFPSILNNIEKKKWLFYRLTKFNQLFLHQYFLDLQDLILKYANDFKKIQLLYNLLEYLNNFFLIKN